MLPAKTTSPCSYYSFENFVNEADRGPIEFNLPRISRKYQKNSAWGREKAAKTAY
jgi:hypothetical protein